GGTYGTALQAASTNGHVAVVQLLLDSSTDKEKYANIVGGHYGTALGAACTRDNVKVAELLIKEGAKAELAREPFGSPLHVAALVGNTKMIELLLENLGDRDPNTKCGLAGIGGEWTH
ncbi:ankyrin repeat-containing domain protein, partial [Mycena olivaceomarginata]